MKAKHHQSFAWSEMMGLVQEHLSSSSLPCCRQFELFTTQTATVVRDAISSWEMSKKRKPGWRKCTWQHQSGEISLEVLTIGAAGTTNVADRVFKCHVLYIQHHDVSTTFPPALSNVRPFRQSISDTKAQHVACQARNPTKNPDVDLVSNRSPPTMSYSSQLMLQLKEDTSCQDEHQQQGTSQLCPCPVHLPLHPLIHGADVDKLHDANKPETIEEIQEVSVEKHRR